MIAWQPELIGGSIAVGSFALFNCYMFAVSRRVLLNVYYLMFIAPGLLHLFNAFIVRGGKRLT